MVIEVEQPLLRKVKLVGSVYRMSKAPGNRKFRIPLIGEYNEEIYKNLLGFDEEEIKKLKKRRCYLNKI